MYHLICHVRCSDLRVFDQRPVSYLQTPKLGSTSPTQQVYRHELRDSGYELLRSLSMRILETRTARECFTCLDRIVSQIFILLISDGEKILSNVNVVV